MKKGLIAALVLSTLSASTAFADGQRIGIFEVEKVYKNASFIKDADKSLQDKVKTMQDQLNLMQNQLKESIGNYEKSQVKMSVDEKVKASADITLQKITLAQKGEEYNRKIQEEKGQVMQEFMKKIRTASAKVAAEKKLDAVMTNHEMTYVSKTIDVTADIEDALK